MTDYQPGTCNINHEESKRRKYAGFAGLFASLILGIIVVGLSLPIYTLIIVFLLGVFGFQGIIQARNNFCVAHAQKGTQKTSDETEDIQDQKDKEKDKDKAREIMIKSLTLGLIVVAVFYLLERFAGL